MSVAWLVGRPLRLILHIDLPSRATIGPGFALVHPYNVLIGPDTEIGAECTIYHEVTLGADVQNRSPKIGSHVVLFAGSRVFGGITIGDRTEIGVNCVVVRDIPPYSLVVAAMPRIIPQSLVRRAIAPPAESGT
jgi:serine O-acetyltransferase